MGNTKKKTGREAPWPFRPTMPEEPDSEAPGVVEAHIKAVAEHKAVYRICKSARNRNEAMRLLMIDGYRYRQQDIPELQRLAALGREWEALLGDIRPGQLAAFLDKLGARTQALPAAGPVVIPEEEAALVRKAAQESAAKDDDLLADEIG